MHTAYIYIYIDSYLCTAVCKLRNSCLQVLQPSLFALGSPRASRPSYQPTRATHRAGRRRAIAFSRRLGGGGGGAGDAWAQKPKGGMEVTKMGWTIGSAQQIHSKMSMVLQTAGVVFFCFCASLSSYW